MVTHAGTIQILDPRPEDVPEERGISSEIPSLEGKVVGLLENRKYHAGRLPAGTAAGAGGRVQGQEGGVRIEIHLQHGLR